MKHLLPLLALPLLLMGCQPKPSKATDKQTADKAAENATNLGQKYKVHGYMETIGSYCGGAAPSREMMDEMRKPKPAAGTKLYIRKGGTNDLKQPIVDSLVVDDQGNYSVSLPNGLYVMLLPEMRDSSAIKGWRAKESKVRVASEQCLKQWFSKGLIALDVLNGPLDVVTITLEKPCFLPLGSSCLRYDGPRPQ